MLLKMQAHAKKTHRDNTIQKVVADKCKIYGKCNRVEFGNGRRFLCIFGTNFNWFIATAFRSDIL